MLIRHFDIAPYNSHYDGMYSEEMKEWRRLCSIDKVNNLQSLLGNIQVKSVLEVGCGTGSVLSEVARRKIGSSHVGIDISDPHAHSDTSDTAVTLMQYDGRVLPFDSKSFDLVFSSHVLEHVPDPRGFLAELSRVAKNVIYLEVPCELNVRTCRKGLQESVNTGHINFYTPESFLLLLQTSRLSVEDIQVFDHSLEVLSFSRSKVKGAIQKTIRHALFIAHPVLATRLFTYHCGAICRSDRLG